MMRLMLGSAAPPAHRAVDALSLSGSSAERAADGLRRWITEGALTPGTRLSEQALGAELGVSRNTLREAFRLLGHEGLLVHQLHRGVFVPELGEHDVVDLYRLRRTVECSVVASLPAHGPDRLRTLFVAVEAAEVAAGELRWHDVGTANMDFHRALVGLADSPRTDEVVARMLAELRLAFHRVQNLRRMFEPYIARNRAIAQRIAAGYPEQAAHMLVDYLHDSETELLAAHRGGGARTEAS